MMICHNRILNNTLTVLQHFLMYTCYAKCIQVGESAVLGSLSDKPNWRLPVIWTEVWLCSAGTCWRSCFGMRWGCCCWGSSGQRGQWKPVGWMWAQGRLERARHWTDLGWQTEQWQQEDWWRRRCSSHQTHRYQQTANLRRLNQLEPLNKQTTTKKTYTYHRSNSWVSEIFSQGN